MVSMVMASFFLMVVSPSGLTMPANRSARPTDPSPQIIDTDCTEASPSAAPQPDTQPSSITSASTKAAFFMSCSPFSFPRARGMICLFT